MRMPTGWLRRGWMALAGLLLLVGTLALGSGTAEASTTVPCRYNGHQHAGYKEYNCGFYTKAPVVDHAGHTVGTLHAGTNWVLCQAQGRTVRSSKYANDWWAYTVADNGRTGWVNAYYGKGGSNYGAFAGVPRCYDHGYPPKHGYAPGVRNTCYDHGGNTITKPSRYCAGPSYNGWTCIGSTFTNTTPNYYRDYGYYGPDCYITY